MAQIVDYSSTPPPAASVATAGFIGAARYLSWLPNPKCLSSAEARDYWAHGLLLATVWEVGVDPTGTDPAQVGAEVDRQMRADGFPDGWMFYIALDEDADPSIWARFAGWGDACSRAARRPWRGYCKSALGEQLAADGHFPSFWDPYAWSGTGQPSPHACLFQRLQTVVVDGTECDVNDVLSADWGGWCPNLPTPAPTPPQTYPEVPMTRHPLVIVTDPYGNGYNDLAVPFDKIIGLFPNGADPATNQAYSPIPRLSASAEGAGTRVELEGGPHGPVLVFVAAAD